MKPIRIIARRSLALALSLLLILSLVPSALAEGESEITNYSASTADDILVSPKRGDGHLNFGEEDDVSTLSTRGEDNKEVSIAAVSIEQALKNVCTKKFSHLENVEPYYLSYVSVPGTQGTIYDGYNNEGDTGAGVAGIRRYYFSERDSSSLVKNISFVPNTSYSGQASISYYGHYRYTAEENGKNVVKESSYAGHIYITVTRQVPGISYATDGEAIAFSADDFATYTQAVNGRTFRYIAFTLPSSEKGALYYNYVDSSIYDFIVTPGTPFYRSTSPSVDKVYYVPKEGYSGEFQLAFSGVDSANLPINGEINITVTNNGPSHTQPRIEGPFVYQVLAGRSVSLYTPSDTNKESAFESECQRNLGSSFYEFRFTSLPEAQAGVLYNDSVSSGSDRRVAANRAYRYPSDIRFSAAPGYSGVVSVPIVVSSRNGKYFDSAIRFIVTDKGDRPLYYTVEPESRVNLNDYDFADACYQATGHTIYRVHFDSLPHNSAGALYCYGDEPVVTRKDAYYYINMNDDRSISRLSFLASSTFTGTVEIPFTGYAYGYSSSNGRSFHGVITITSNKTVIDSTEKPPIGGTSSLFTYYTSGPAVSLNASDLILAASAALPGAPVKVYLGRPENGTGKLCLDFASLSRNEPFDSALAHDVADLSRVSFLPKAGFSGTTRITYTMTDAQGNSFAGNLQFVVTPPTHSQYFSDMDGVKWAIPAVDFFRYYGTTNGTSLTAFGPNAPMKRGDFLLLLSRAFALPGYGRESFADVPQDKYYAEAIASAKALGIATGEATDNFDPEGAIKREDAALFLYRALRRIDAIEPGSAAELSRFPDGGTVSPYAAEAMGALVRDGVFQGYVHNLLPARTLSRAETITILYRGLT